MYKKNKSLIFIAILIIFLLAIFIIAFSWESKEENIDPTKIAACPTFYFRINHLDSENFSLILSDSTSESLSMLARGQVDYAVGGRSLLPHEPNFNFSVVGHGFSFLSDQTKVIYDYQLSNIPLYTDLDIEILRENFGDLDYIAVDDVYDYLEDNIVITEWDNSDFNRAEIVHLIRYDNSRVIESRLPTVFCQNICDYSIVDNIKNSIN